MIDPEEARPKAKTEINCKLVNMGIWCVSPKPSAETVVLWDPV